MAPAPRTGPRQVTFRLLALVMAAFWGFFFFGLIDLLAFAAGPDFHTSLMLSTGWGLVFLFLVAAPLLAVGMRPHLAAPAALGLVAAVAAAVTAGALLSGSVPHLTVAAGLAATVVLIAAAGDRRRAMWRPSWRRSAVPMVLVAAAAVPWSAYAWAAARSTGANPVADETWGLDHWPIQAALPVALLLGGGARSRAPLGMGRPDLVRRSSHRLARRDLLVRTAPGREPGSTLGRCRRAVGRGLRGHHTRQRRPGRRSRSPRTGPRGGLNGRRD